MAFDQSTRNRLQKFVSIARNLLTDEFTRQLQATYGLDPKSGSVAEVESLTHLDNRQRQTAHSLRETMAHYLASTPGKGEKDRTKQVLNRIVREQAFTVLNRLAALRMAESRGFLLESISKAHNSKGFQLYRQLSGTAHGETGDAYRNYLFSLFDEFSLDLAVLFDRHSAQGRLFPRESSLLELLAEINHHEIEHLWAEDETIGWIYQYFNSQEERKKMRDPKQGGSQAPRNSRELAVRNQFFTPRYVVEFLTDNTLGRIWYEMTQGSTGLVDSCRYLVRRPTEVFLKPGEAAPETDQADSEALSQKELLKQPVYIPHRPLKDPRNIRMLDPACGSMHFGLYAFDLFERIYLEAWQLEQQLGPDGFAREEGLQPLQTSFASLEAFQQQIPKLIIEHNIHGVDIDPRAVQIAGLSLWQRAQRAWHQQGIKPQQRPTIVKSNIVCAEPMPGEKALLQEFTSKLNPPILGQLLEVIFDKMQLAGEAGTLLKIEEEIQTAIHEAREQWVKQSGSQSMGDMFQAELDAATPQAKLGFDLRGIDDEIFWDDAERRILEALSDYADQAESNADQKRLFAEDAAKGFAFIDLCRKRFDVVLMNPPFAEASIKTESYIDSNYGKPSSRAVYAPFISRSVSFSVNSGIVGALSARGAYYLSTYEKWRENLLDSSEINEFADLGFGIFEGPIVETVALTISIAAETKIEKPSTFFRLLDTADRQPFLIDCCNLKHSKRIFQKSTDDFLLIPTAPFAYWYPSQFFSLFKRWQKLKADTFTACQGMSTTDDFRYLRSESEVSEDRCADFPAIAKGGEYATYFSELDMRVNWALNGKELNANKKAVLRNSSYYFKPGITWTEGTTSCFSARYLPPGSAISGSGQGIFCVEESKYSNELIFGLLAYLNSRLAHVFIEAMVSSGDFSQAGGVVRHYTTDLIGRIPIPDNEMLKKISQHGEELFQLQKLIFDAYNLPTETVDQIIVRLKNSDLNTVCHERWVYIAVLTNKCIELVNLVDAEIARYSQIDPLWLDQLSGPLICSARELQEDDLVDETLRVNDSELVNKVFDLYPIRRIKKLGYYIHRRFENLCLALDVSAERLESIADKDPHYQVYPQKYAHKILVSTIEETANCIKTGVLGSTSDEFCALSNIIRNYVGKLDDCGDATERQLARPFGLDNFYGLFSNVSKFFSIHYSEHSRNRRYSPVLWPLQTPSSSFTLWVYYHRLNEQTLYTCVNDFIDGPNGKLTQVEQDLNTLRGKSARSSQEEKELEKRSDLASELRDFRDELLHLAKFWKPNLNDGVQITAAPLWKLFQHKAWQKKLKETWESLEKGDYDWAHLAFSIWPERVLRKCHQDRSLAIAHNVEKHFWQEAEVPVKRGKKTTGEAKLEWQPKDLSEAELTALVKQLAAEVK